MTQNPLLSQIEIATLAGGCFWCTEAIFKRLRGVESITSGYSGGNLPSPIQSGSTNGKKPTYEQVCSGTTGHAESIQIRFNPSIISYKKLLEVFFKLHDPTTLNQQGADIGTQYRSAIFYHTEQQKQLAEEARKEAQSLYIKPIVTKIEPFIKFYAAEDYHQNYYEANKSAPYCQIVIDPKIQKLISQFQEVIKK